MQSLSSSHPVDFQQKKTGLMQKAGKAHSKASAKIAKFLNSKRFADPQVNITVQAYMAGALRSGAGQAP